MQLRHRFLGQIRAHQAEGHDVGPEMLAAAAAEAVGAQAGTLCLLPPLLRLPLGTSCAGATLAEQVQASFGGGPCVESGHRLGPVLAGEKDLVDRWHVYHRSLVARTPFRSVLSVPLLRAGGRAFAALDLYSVDPDWRPGPCAVVQAELADLVSMLVLAGGTRAAGVLASGTEDWTGRRRHTWVAVGMLCAVTGVTEIDAIALLRGHACSADRLLDEVADDVVSGRIGVQTLVR